ncbi:hypothetical protein J23TS9_31500 [Paenibacillus sp. J23TS9]|nr:hypothetical protein J23TS9_31500 [Paenibacillus sp. J23TS9]
MFIVRKDGDNECDQLFSIKVLHYFWAHGIFYFRPRKHDKVNSYQAKMLQKKILKKSLHKTVEDVIL